MTLLNLNALYALKAVKHIAPAYLRGRTYVRVYVCMYNAEISSGFWKLIKKTTIDIFTVHFLHACLFMIQMYTKKKKK